MRSAQLNALFASVTSVKGVGEKASEGFERLCGTRAKDVLFHVPVGYVDRRYSPRITNIAPGEVVTLTVTVEKHIIPPKNSRAPYRILCTNESGVLHLVFFGKFTQYLRSKYPEGKVIVVSGKAEVFGGKVQISHPDYMVDEGKMASITAVESVYPLTKGITQKLISTVVKNIFNNLPDVEEWHRKETLERHHFPSWKKALQDVHFPENVQAREQLHLARQRLIFDEFVAHQLALASSRERVQKTVGEAMVGTGELTEKLRNALPFSLTQGQQDVLKEATQDLSSPYKMVRLLQGDVGSGKTIVAIMAMLYALEAGKQAALMAPTAILAIQHAMSLEKMLQDAGMSDEVRVVLFTGKDKGKARAEKLAMLADGKCNIAVGTHTLFQEKVVFEKLGLVVIDEQHRFGVKQRLALTSKGDNTDILLMSATPIPRTLTLTLYGDMEISILKEKPAGRQAIDTRIMPATRIPDIAKGLQRPIEKGERIYWVCPLVEENEESNLVAVEERVAYLQKLYGKRVVMLHGKMKNDEKDAVMMEFKQGNVDILVATTVIEVGVDVPEATIMVIEQAERFGLSQLHQLRGRVGRGSQSSSCLLLYSDSLSENGKRRLEIMRQTDDGFLIAEEDLAIRGEGDVLGTQQSGLPRFKMGDLPEDRELLFAAREEVGYIIKHDVMHKPEGAALQNLLYLFDYDLQVSYLTA